jgi:hypothetical protein
MEFKDIASVAGKPGLFKITAPTRNGVILESLDDKKQKFIAGPNHRVSVLSDISIYTTTSEGAEPLKSIIYKIYNEFDDDPGVDSNSSKEELYAFMEFILPELDKNRVYPSDIKKVVNWYKALYSEAPELLKEQEEKSDENGEGKPTGGSSDEQ